MNCSVYSVRQRMTTRHRKKPILSLPIDKQLDLCIRRDMRDEHLSRADIVRRILRIHYGLIRNALHQSRITA